MFKMKIYNKYFSIFILILLSTILLCGSNTKTWNSNFDYETELKRISCSKDRIIFAENSVFYFNEKITAKEIVLPKNGQIIFGDKASISLVDNNDQNQCNAKDIKLSQKEDNDWFDPYNWNQTIDVLSSNQLINEYKFVGRSEDQNPMPHMERIPCLYDSVYFLSNTSFKVRIHLNTRITIKSLKIWDKWLTTTELKGFIESAIGQQLFTINGLNDNFKIDDNMICNDPKGCVCGNEEPVILSKICEAVSHYDCPTLQCSDPIRPVGHCCDICGSMLTIKYKDNFNLDLLQGITTLFQIRAEYTTVGSYLHKLKSQKFQFIALDLGAKGLADKMVKAIKQYFNDGPGIYAIDSIDIQSSTQWSTSSAGIWVLIIFIILILIGSAVVVSYYYKKRRIPANFAFARFHGVDSEDGVELQMGTTPHEALDPNAPIQMNISAVKSGQQSTKEVVTFENPIFSKHELKAKEKTSQEKSSELTSVENPFFSNED